jgi:hypothetical protein
MAKFGVDPHGRWDKNLAESQFKGHVENIIGKYKQASSDFVKGGNEWYSKAHDEATRVGGGDPRRGAGIIAALSPLNNWERNVSEAHELIKTGNVKSALLPANVEKARRIHGGEDPESVLGGHKVTNFFHNIHDPSNPEHVTIDRHAYDIAMGHPFVGAGGGKAKRNITEGPSGHVPMSEDLGLSSMGRYKHFVHAYRHAAGELGVDLPHQVQATTWVTHRGAIG